MADQKNQERCQEVDDYIAGFEAPVRERLEADVAPWKWLQAGVLAAGGISAAVLAVWTGIAWKKRRPPLAEQGET